MRVIQEPVKEGNLRLYLLGTLSEEESTELESLYFASNEVFEDLIAEEDDLVDAYVTDELRLDERTRFDRLLSGSSRLRNRVATARAMRRQRGPSRRALPVRALLLLAATVILALGVFWAVRKPLPVSEIATSTPVPPAATPAVVAAIPVPATGSPRRVFSFVLAAGLTRDVAEAATVAIPKGTETVELRLPLETDAFSSYDVQLRTEGGGDVLERLGLRSRKEHLGAVVAVEVPAATLHPGGYTLTLRGHLGRGTIETLDQYIFRVPMR